MFETQSYSPQNEKPLAKESGDIIIKRLLSLRVPDIPTEWDPSKNIIHAIDTLLKSPDIPRIIAESNQELRNAHKEILKISPNSLTSSEKYEIFRVLFRKHMVAKYGLFFSDEQERVSHYFIALERWQDSESIRRYREIIKPWEPEIQSGINFYRIKSGEEMKAHFNATNIDNVVVINERAVNNIISNINKTQWTGKWIPIFTQAQFREAVVMNELASIAFESMFKNFTFTLQGKNFWAQEVSEYYSDIMSLRTDIRDMRRILINATTKQKFIGYDLTHQMIYDYLEKTGTKIGPDNINDLDLYREIQRYMENWWWKIFDFIKSSKYRK